MESTSAAAVDVSVWQLRPCMLATSAPSAPTSHTSKSWVRGTGQADQELEHGMCQLLAMTFGKLRKEQAQK